jgi:hypothetical protein
VDELPFAADRCPCVEKLRTCHQLLLASETVRCSWCPPWAVSSDQHEQARRREGESFRVTFAPARRRVTAAAFARWSAEVLRCRKSTLALSFSTQPIHPSGVHCTRVWRCWVCFGAGRAAHRGTDGSPAVRGLRQSRRPSSVLRAVRPFPRLLRPHSPPGQPQRVTRVSSQYSPRRSAERGRMFPSPYNSPAATPQVAWPTAPATAARWVAPPWMAPATHGEGM